MDAEKQTALEIWEVELAQNVASRYAGQVDTDDLAGELSLFLLKLKQRRLPQITDWRAYLAKSLLRRADRIVRSWSHRQEKTVCLESVVSGASGDIRLEDLLAAGAGEPDELLLGGLLSAYQELGPEEKQLWDLLMEESGDTAKVARRLGKPRTTVDYHIQKLRKNLKIAGWS